MATLREIKRRISSVKSTQQITKAMKMVAAARLRRAQENILKARPYAYKIDTVLTNLASKVDRNLHPLLDKRDPKSMAVVCVTSDRGLCGGFNTNIIRQTKHYFEECEIENKVLINIGFKGWNHFKKRDYNIIGEYTRFFSDLEFAHANRIGHQLIDLYLQKKLDKVVLIYNEFKSVLQQKIVVEDLLPIEPQEEEKKAVIDYIYEPEPVKILDAITPLHINIQIWRVLLESYASEMAARMNAMENATDNAQEMIESLVMLYNRIRQATITKEISEIVGGAEALKG
ncbi:ATP synthase F1 subunit gamma [candidate division KSB1 bacterium]